MNGLVWSAVEQCLGPNGMLGEGIVGYVWNPMEQSGVITEATNQQFKPINFDEPGVHYLLAKEVIGAHYGWSHQDLVHPINEHLKSLASCPKVKITSSKKCKSFFQRDVFLPACGRTLGVC